MGLLSRLFQRSREPALDRAAFAATLHDRLGPEGVTRAPGNAFALVSRTGKEMQLENLYKAYLRGGSLDRITDLVRGAMAETETGPASGSMPGKEELLERVLPVIRPAGLAESGGGTPVTKLNEELAVFLVADSEHSLVYANDNVLEHASLDRGVAYARALENLRARTPPKIRKWKDVNLFIGDWNDDYDSSRVLLREMFGFFEAIRKPRAAIPSRGRLLFWDADDAAAQAAAMPIIEECFTNDPGPLYRGLIDL